MALKYGDRVLETSTSTGTGAFTLAGAVTGYQTFAAICSASDTIHYAIFSVDAAGTPSGAWETGLGTYSGTDELTRTTVTASSNAGSAVNFASGTKWVIGSPTASLFASLVVAGAVTGSGLTMATGKLLGRSTASTGAIEEITVGAGLTLSGGSLASLVTQYTDENALDALGTALVAGSGITITPNDGADTITIASTGGYTDEQARDAIGTALVAGSGITITPNDGADTITIAASGSSGGAWSLVSTTTISSPVSQVDLTGLGSYQDLLLIAEDVSQNATGFLAIRLSVDNGSTFYSSAGNYVTVTSAGDKSATGNTEIRLFDSTASAIRTAYAEVMASNINGGPKLVRMQNAQGIKALFKGSTSPINAVRLFSTSGNTLLAGTVYLFGRS